MFSVTFRITFIFVISFALQTTLSACTTFVLNDGVNLLFGRNLDWVSDNGVIVVNKRGVAKTALVLPPHRSAVWTSKYGSVTFNQFGAEFPFGGMNEEGLVVEIMLAPASYPTPDDRSAVNELQWVQYQLDNASTVEEVIQSDEVLRIQKINQNLHFLICDAMGNTAVIEFINGKMKAYSGSQLPIPVLENDTYSTSLDKYNAAKACRFSTAAKAFEAFPSVPQSDKLEFAFETLEAVALDASWSIVYDIKNRQIYFNTASNRSVSSFSLAKFDFSCSAPAKLFDLHQKRSAEVSNSFESFNFNLNASKMKDGIRTNAIRLPAVFVDALLNYPTTCSCTQD